MGAEKREPRLYRVADIDEYIEEHVTAPAGEVGDD